MFTEPNQSSLHIIHQSRQQLLLVCPGHLTPLCHLPLVVILSNALSKLRFLVYELVLGFSAIGVDDPLDHEGAGALVFIGRRVGKCHALYVVLWGVEEFPKGFMQGLALDGHCSMKFREP